MAIKFTISGPHDYEATFEVDEDLSHEETVRLVEIWLDSLKETAAILIPDDEE